MEDDYIPPDHFENLRLFFQVFSTEEREGVRKGRGKVGEGRKKGNVICINTIISI